MRRYLLILLLAWAPASFALTADNLLLVTNKNVPEGRKLAEFYAAQRKVPDGRILDLDLPTADEVSFNAYENDVVPVVREFLAKHGLGTKVTGVVTFYGVPLRVGVRVNTPADAAERDATSAELQPVQAAAEASVAALEAYAKQMNPTFVPSKEKTLAALVARDRAARTAVGAVATKIKESAKVDAIVDRVEALVTPLIGRATVAQQRMQALAQVADRWTPEQRQEAEKIRAGLLEMRAQFDALQNHRGDPESRAKLRALVKNELGLFEYGRLLDGMGVYFETDSTDAAFDSELALVHWNYYKRSGWLPNPLFYKSTPNPNAPPVLMIARLDAPKAETVRAMIAAGIKVEAEGLRGKVVIDSGGHLAIDARNGHYIAFDGTLRALADIVRTKTKLPLVFDENRDVLPPNSASGVAIYCGWYALQNYTPACSFVEGAVGYHIASYELTTLRNPNKQWCAGLLNDGIAATVGPVNEPFLSTFPQPDDFFPVLFTGKLNLVETYWKTTPAVSWRMALVGDPLYNPFGANPAMPVDGLHETLRPALLPP